MKKFLVYFFSFFFLIVALFSILLSLVDKQEIVNSIKKQIINNNNYQVDFDDDSSISLFPYPNVEINNLTFSNQIENLNLFLKVENINLISNWSSIIKGKPKITRLDFVYPKIIFSKEGLNENVATEKLMRNINIAINKQNFFFENVEKIVTTDGEVLLQLPNNNYLIEDLDFTYNKKNEDKKIEGNFSFKKFDSIFDFKLKTKDLINFDILLNQKLNTNKEMIIWNLNAERKHKIRLFGDVVSDSINLNSFNFGLYQRFEKINSKRFFVNSNSNTTEFEIFFLIKKITTTGLTLKDSKFFIQGNENYFKIKDIKTKINNSNLTMNANIDVKNKKITGSGFLKDYIIPDSFLGDAKYSLYGGKSKIEFNFLKNNFYFGDEFLSKLSLKSKILIENPTLKGINLNTLFLKIKEISSLDDILGLVEITNTNGSSKLNFISSDLNLLSNELSIKNLVVRDINFEMRGNGFLDLKKNILKMDNNIKFLDKDFSDFPSFPLKVTGPIDNLKYNYDLNYLKNSIIEKGLNIILKNTNEITIDPKKIFENLDKEKTDTLKEIFENIF
mgnify:CR=1 FL=1